MIFTQEHAKALERISNAVNGDPALSYEGQVIDYGNGLRLTATLHAGTDYSVRCFFDWPPQQAEHAALVREVHTASSDPTFIAGWFAAHAYNMAKEYFAARHIRHNIIRMLGGLPVSEPGLSEPNAKQPKEAGHEGG